ncbi:hypothetical protein CBL_03175 [Carabus blaptoides fortunei]
MKLINEKTYGQPSNRWRKRYGFRFLKENLTIVAGATILSDGGDVYQVSEIIYHEGWGTGFLTDDIGLLKTDRDIQFGDKVKVMQLGTQEVPVGKKLLLTGWGLTSYPGKYSDRLKFIELTSISLDTCATALEPMPLFNTQFCTYNQPGEGACTSDSGGPLVYMDRVVGIVSYGHPCAIGKPDVFTKNEYSHCTGTTAARTRFETSLTRKYPKENLKIVAGATKLSDGGDVYKVLTAVYHEGWGSLRINDIGLLLTDEHIQFGDNVNFMHLGTQEVPLDRNLLLTGWGYTTNPGESSDHLKFIELTSISLKLCTAALETLLFDTQLCTYNGLGEGACEGDSGSPLVYMNRLVGIASYGRQCAIGKPDVFTKVSAYIPWITETIRENERNTTI